MRSLKFLAFLLTLPIVLNSPVVIAQSTDQFFDQGKAAHDAGDYQKAENIWRQLLKREPNNAEAHYRLGRTLRDQQRSDEAIAEFREAIRLNPKHSYAYNGLGTVLQWNQNKLDEAVTAYRQAIELDHNNHYAYFNWGNALVEKNQPDEAIKLFIQAIKIEPNSPFNYHSLGTAYRLKKNFDAAIAAYRKAIDLYPSYSDAYVSWGNTLAEEKRFNEAIQVYLEAVKVDSQNAYVYNSLGRAYYLQNNFAEALAAYRKAIQINPKDPYPYNGLGITFMAQGRLEEAINELQRATNLDPNFASAQNNLREAQRLLALGNPQPFVTANPQPSPEEDEAYKAATALIITKASDGNFSRGTGWVFKQENKTVWVVTNRHVVSNEQLKQISKDIFVEFYSSDLPDAKRPRYRATIEKITNFNDSELDLAVLKVTEITSEIQSFNDRLGVNLRGTRRVRIIGHPITIKYPWTIVSGEVINQDSQAGDMDIDANLAEGNSGSPVVDEQQQLIGMVVQIGTKRDISPDPDEPTPSVSEDTTSTRGVGKAYRIDKVIEQLRAWNILK
ncbi:tetratricopeptide repeat protein [Desmonostoc muscorum CCALA 125]|nr:tetratricopeptide repeat protein [Desmonostoc muscorum CCALA 125]